MEKFLEIVRIFLHSMFTLNIMAAQVPETFEYQWDANKIIQVNFQKRMESRGKSQALARTYGWESERERERERERESCSCYANLHQGQTLPNFLQRMREEEPGWQQLGGECVRVYLWVCVFVCVRERERERGITKRKEVQSSDFVLQEQGSKTSTFTFFLLYLTL